MLVKKCTSKKDCSVAVGRMSREERRELIIGCAVKLFAEYGFNGTTTKKIAHSAGVSEASLFQHFNSKAELYAAILDDKAKRVYESGWVDKIKTFIDANDDEKVLRAVASKITEHCQSDPNFIRLMLYTALEKHENAQPFRRRLLYPVFELLRDYIEKRKNEGFFQDCSAEAAAFAFISTQVYYAMGNILFQSQMLTITEDEAISDFIKLSLDGLSHNAHRAKVLEKDFCWEKQK